MPLGCLLHLNHYPHHRKRHMSLNTDTGGASGLKLCGNDGSFGPSSSCRKGGLDFTITFEQSILSLVPNILFLLFALLRIYFLSRKPSRLLRRFDFLLALKLLSTLLLVGSSAAVIALYKDAEGMPTTTMGACAMGLVAAIVYLPLSVLEHRNSLAPSTLLSSYTISLGLFGAAELRTLEAVNFPSSPCTAKAVAVASLFALLILESTSKRFLLKPKYNNLPLATTTSFLLKPFFPHLLPLLYLGYKRRLTLDDLESIPPHMLAVPAGAKLMNSLAKGDQSSTFFLLKASLSAFGAKLGGPALPKLFLTLFTFGQVFLVQGVTRFIADPRIDQARGWALVGGFVIIYSGIALSTYLYWEKVFDISVEYRGGLIGAMYTKTLKLTSVAAREVGQGAATTYMSVDAERVTVMLQFVHEMWASLLAIALGFTMLWFQASYAIPFVFVFILLAITGTLAKSVGASQTAWMSCVDKRIRLLTSMFSQLLPIKLGAYENPLMEKARVLRLSETVALRHFYFLLILTSTLASLGSTFSGLVTIGCYAVVLRFGPGFGPLDISRIFTILTIIGLLAEPISMLGQALPSLFGGWASMKRIQSFLVLPEKPLPAPTSKLDASDDSSSNTESRFSSAFELPLSHVQIPNGEVVAEIIGGSFGWDEKTVVLEDINLRLVSGELHMIVGSVASGKSTLLMALLGETVQLKGSMDVQARKIALATQTPFIYPGTFRSNVLLDQSFNQASFDRVIEACGLTQDLDRLPNREHTVLGERGITLSGGQRQRLSLARAVYAEADLILLDDTFSALDGETEAHVFSSLFGPAGLLKGKTVVLITHGIQHLPSADKVIVMASGKISQFGTFEQVRDSGNPFQQRRRCTSRGNEKRSQGVEAEKSKKDDSLDSILQDEEVDEELLWSNDKNRKTAAFKFFFSAVGVRGCFLLSVFVILLAAVQRLGFRASFSKAPTGNFGAWMGGYVSFAVATGVLQVVTFYYFTVILTQRGSLIIHALELTGLMNSPPSFFQKNSPGKILNRFSEDIQAADFIFPLCILAFFLSILSLITTLIFVVIAAPWLGLSLVVLGPTFWFILAFYLSTSKQLQRLDLGAKSPLYTLFSTSVGGLTSIRAFRASRYFEDINVATLNRAQGPFYYRQAGQLFLRTVLTWITGTIAVGLAILAVGLRSSTSAALLGVAMSQITGLSSSLMGTMITYAEVENSIVSLERIQEFALLPSEDPNPSSYESEKPKDRSWPSKGALEFQGVSIRYREELDLALDSVSFSLEGGKKIGICGRTGSGKSSTLLALFRAIDHGLMSGQILIDGIDISTLPLHQLRDSMSIVTQDPFLVGTLSVRDNLDLDGRYSDDEIWEALRSVGMADVISELPEKLESLAIVDEESFSKGQRQLLCLARCILRKRQIVVLDESTSSMDHLTDQMIKKVIAEMKDQTVLAIAHRISTIIDYDLILLLDDGKVAEFDAPQTLLADPHSRFAKLAATQGIFHSSRSPVVAQAETASLDGKKEE
ncbi:P-loop containing nucleoside triphosphate hydrolase protein [Mrakia frigida]|uniref:P-loop containing nucleoside triphosphate hydrolase protein n=1 Tax=Mrakia frigida TaxID=29902 RepID=UPI003FCBF7D9